MASWREYQEQAAEFFQSLGLEVETDAKIKGTRTKHDIDVLVRSRHVGFEVMWIVECKLWKRRVSKLHVLALREIVADLGADRGILLSEAGFQSGAFEPANLTNVQLTSLAELKESAEGSILAMRLRDLFDRVQNCKTRYWDIPKEERIKAGLRPEVLEDGYSGRIVIDACTDLLTYALRGTYPFHVDRLEAIGLLGKGRSFGSPKEVEEAVRRMVEELEARLSKNDKGVEA